MVGETAAEAAYREALREIDRVRAAGGTELSLSGEYYYDLDRIPSEVAAIEGLEYLSLAHTKVSDLSPLRGLTLLGGLQLVETAVSDLSPLQGMTALRNLWLSQTAVSDLSPLRDMISMEALSLNETAVSNLSPLRKMTSMRTLGLEQTAVNDISPLRAMTSLTTLELSQTDVSDLAPLAEMADLRRLFLYKTKVRNLNPLSQLSALQGLVLDQTGVTDLRPLVDLSFENIGVSNGLSFANTPSTLRDPELRRLSYLKGPKQRTRETLAYLKTLPPWPEPYTPATRGDVPVPGQIGPSENQSSSKIAREEPPMSRGALKAKTSAAHIRFLQREPELTRLTAQSVATQIRDAMLEMRRRSNDIPDALLKIESLADALEGIGNAPLGPKGEKRIEDLQLRIAQLEAVIEKLTADLTVSKAATTNPNGFAATLSKEAAREIATSLGFLTRLGAIAGLVYFIGPTNPVATGLIGAWAAITKLVK